MITMSMGNEQMRDGFAVECRQQGINVRREIRSGIHHGDIALSDDVGSSPVPGKRAWIARHDAAKHGRHPFHTTVFEIEFAAKGNGTGHNVDALSVVWYSYRRPF